MIILNGLKPTLRRRRSSLPVSRLKDIEPSHLALMVGKRGPEDSDQNSGVDPAQPGSGETLGQGTRLAIRIDAALRRIIKKAS